jgi:hypothetical protein
MRHVFVVNNPRGILLHDVRRTIGVTYDTPVVVVGINGPKELNEGDLLELAKKNGMRNDDFILIASDQAPASAVTAYEKRRMSSSTLPRLIVEQVQ